MLLAAATRVLGCTGTVLPGTNAIPWLRTDSAILQIIRLVRGVLVAADIVSVL